MELPLAGFVFQTGQRKDLQIPSNVLGQVLLLECICSYHRRGKNKQNSDFTKVERNKENKLTKLAAGVLTLGSVSDASAKTGGIGGQAFCSSAPRSSPRINNNSRSQRCHWRRWQF